MQQIYKSAILIKLQINFIEITLWPGRSPVNLLHIFRTLFPKNTSGGYVQWKFKKQFRQVRFSGISMKNIP